MDIKLPGGINSVIYEYGKLSALRCKPRTTMSSESEISDEIEDDSEEYEFTEGETARVTSLDMHAMHACNDI